MSGALRLLSRKRRAVGGLFSSSATRFLGSSSVAARAEAAPQPVPVSNGQLQASHNLSDFGAGAAKAAATPSRLTTPSLRPPLSPRGRERVESRKCYVNFPEFPAIFPGGLPCVTRTGSFPRLNDQGRITPALPAPPAGLVPKWELQRVRRLPARSVRLGPQGEATGRAPGPSISAGPLHAGSQRPPPAPRREVSAESGPPSPK